MPGAGSFASVSVTTEPGFVFGNPTPLPVGGTLREGGPYRLRPIDIMPDGTQLLGILLGVETEGEDSLRVHVVQKWFEELTRLVPAD